MDDALGPLEGFRMWRTEACTLLAMNGREWTATGEAAECIGGAVSAEHPVPDVRCSCGYYALTTLDDLKPFAMIGHGPGNAGLFDGSVVIGPVKGWGRAIPHEFGWRAEFAKPLGFYELTLPPVPRDVRCVVRQDPSGVDHFVYNRRRRRSLLIELARRYGVPRMIPPYELRALVWGAAVAAVERHQGT